MGPRTAKRLNAGNNETRAALWCRPQPVVSSNGERRRAVKAIRRRLDKKNRGRPRGASPPPFIIRQQPRAHRRIILLKNRSISACTKPRSRVSQSTSSGYASPIAYNASIIRIRLSAVDSCSTTTNKEKSNCYQ